MPLYFFDYVEDTSMHIDASGMELADAQEASDHAACLIGTMLGEQAEALGNRALSVTVRERDGRPVYVAHATFHGYRAPREPF